MVINNVELEDLDIFDLDVFEKFQNELEKVKNGAEEAAKIPKVSDAMRQQCKLVFECFNNLFGEGTDKKVFGNKVNLLTCLKAFEELVQKINEQKGEVEKLVNKYSPNRVQRRAKK